MRTAFRPGTQTPLAGLCPPDVALGEVIPPRFPLHQQLLSQQGLRELLPPLLSRDRGTVDVSLGAIVVTGSSGTWALLPRAQAPRRLASPRVLGGAFQHRVGSHTV